MISTEQLHKQIYAVCPIDGVAAFSAGEDLVGLQQRWPGATFATDASGTPWRIDFALGVSDQQKVDAQAVVAAFVQ